MDGGGCLSAAVTDPPSHREGLGGVNSGKSGSVFCVLPPPQLWQPPGMKRFGTRVKWVQLFSCLQVLARSRVPALVFDRRNMGLTRVLLLVVVELLVAWLH